MVITSMDNAKVALAHKLLDKKYRLAYNKYLIEGERLVRDAILHGAQVETVFVKESCQSKYSFENAVVVADRVFSKICDTVNNQGVLAIVNKASDIDFTAQGNVLVLDGLQDPGNVGTLFRTAVACGFTDIFAVNCVDVYSPKVLRSAMSAHFSISIHQDNDMQSVFQKLSSYVLLAADMGGENLFETKLQGKVAVVLGNEGNGLSDYSRQNVNKVVALPMENSIESLNVAIAGSVIMYHIYTNK